MIASRILYSFLTLGVISAAATPAAITVEKCQSTADIKTVLNTLKSSTDAILPQITNLGNVTDENVTPLINDLTAALNTASSSLASLETYSDLQGRVDTNSGGSQQDVANAVAPIYRNIVVSLNNLKTQNPEFASLFTKFGTDAALNNLLLGLGTLLAGVVELIAVL
ncbi:hypothetical protein BDQ12DRAFT_749549 [Crucibulum laeve]|uniref:Hydrophobic surface binding protein A-domain-containing protein n=1 Tax=Crucibulum laeve TaxID=68775 RepID=A0A5C3M0X3_9AGAR|nr:hypothetical protein BDQ12DRAFT_749549 [Crucibulum laeve]